MATLGELKARIIRETSRDELADAPGGDPTAASAADLDRAIAGAIGFHAAKRFWFNETARTTVTTPGGTSAPAPAGLRLDDDAWFTIGGQRRTLRKAGLIALNEQLGHGPAQGQPWAYARDGAWLRFYPAPDAAYTVTVHGLYDLVPLAGDDDANAWTTEAQDLIAARARFLLLRDLFRDPEGAGLARSAEEEALAALRGEGTLRTGVGRLRAWA
jgi:hypothetical protein